MYHPKSSIRLTNYIIHRHKYCTIIVVFLACSLFFTYLYVNNAIYNNKVFGKSARLHPFYKYVRAKDSLHLYDPDPGGSFDAAHLIKPMVGPIPSNINQHNHQQVHFHQRLPQAAQNPGSASDVAGSIHSPNIANALVFDVEGGRSSSKGYASPGDSIFNSIKDNADSIYSINYKNKHRPSYVGDKDILPNHDLYHHQDKTMKGNNVLPAAPIIFPYAIQSQSTEHEKSRPAKTYKWKVLCWVLTNPANLPTRTIYVKKTWGPRCDKTLYLSTLTDPSFPTIGLLDISADGSKYFNQSSPPAKTTNQATTTPPSKTNHHHHLRRPQQSTGTTLPTRSQMSSTTPKSRRIIESKQLNSEKATQAWTYVYDNYYNDYDFFYKTDDDTYVIVENLREYLETKDPLKPEFYGHRFILRGKNVTYMSGGSGFVLTKQALKQLVTYAFKKYPTCIPKGAGEDWKTARCLQIAGAKPVDTRDELGRERFLVFPPKSHLAGTYPAWYYKYDIDGSVKGLGCCAYYPISFHYIRGTELLMIDYFLYRMRVLGDENFADTFIPGQSKDIIDFTTVNTTTTKPTTKSHFKAKNQGGPGKRIIHYISSTAKIPLRRTRPITQNSLLINANKKANTVK